jgi:HEPN domain-containing protein
MVGFGIYDEEVNRRDLQSLTLTRLKEAKALLRLGHDAGAYYLAGYSMECALKACIAKRTRQHDFPDRQKANEAYTHSLPALVKAAGLEDLLRAHESTDREFGENWLTTKRWSELSRYDRNISTDAAKDLLAAITDRKHGVLIWVKRCW